MPISHINIYAVWNEIGRRSTTQDNDIHAILAGLTDFSPTRMMSFISQVERTKMMLLPHGPNSDQQHAQRHPSTACRRRSSGSLDSFCARTRITRGRAGSLHCHGSGHRVRSVVTWRYLCPLLLSGEGEARAQRPVPAPKWLSPIYIRDEATPAFKTRHRT